MKILIISNMYPSKEKPYAGIFVKNQYERLKKIMPDDEIHIFFMRRKFTNTIFSIYKYLLTFIRFIPYLFRSYDILHVHFFYPLILLAYLYKKLHRSSKLVVTFHGTDITKHINSKLNKKIYSHLAHHIDIVIAVGKDLATEVEDKLNIEVNKVLSAGIDEAIFYKEKNIIKEYDYLFVGSFIGRKGADIFINSIKKIKSENIKFCFVGSGILLKEIEELNKEQVKIYQNLNQNELRIIYNKSKFFVLPSRNEPFGLVVTESLFCGTPAIVSSNGGLKEQIRHNENGYILRDNSPEALTNIILETNRISNEEYEKLSTNAHLSNKSYSLENICSELKQIYSVVYDA